MSGAQRISVPLDFFEIKAVTSLLGHLTDLVHERALSDPDESLQAWERIMQKLEPLLCYNAALHTERVMQKEVGGALNTLFETLVEEHKQKRTLLLKKDYPTYNNPQWQLAIEAQRWEILAPYLDDGNDSDDPRAERENPVGPLVRYMKAHSEEAERFLRYFRILPEEEPLQNLERKQWHDISGAFMGLADVLSYLKACCNILDTMTSAKQRKGFSDFAEAHAMDDSTRAETIRNEMMANGQTALEVFISVLEKNEPELTAEQEDALVLALAEHLELLRDKQLLYTVSDKAANMTQALRVDFWQASMLSRMADVFSAYAEQAKDVNWADDPETFAQTLQHLSASLMPHVGYNSARYAADLRERSPLLADLYETAEQLTRLNMLINYHIPVPGDSAEQKELFENHTNALLDQARSQKIPGDTVAKIMADAKGAGEQKAITYARDTSDRRTYGHAERLMAHREELDVLRRELINVAPTLRKLRNQMLVSAMSAEEGVDPDTVENVKQFCNPTGHFRHVLSLIIDNGLPLSAEPDNIPGK